MRACENGICNRPAVFMARVFGITIPPKPEVNPTPLCSDCRDFLKDTGNLIKVWPIQEQES